MERVITGWRRYTMVQPPIMVLIFAQSMSSNILTDLIVYRTCSITLGINSTECSLLHKNNSCSEALKLNAQVQPKASLILMSKSIIENVLPVLLSLFLGPWSDRYGRKPILLSGYIGISLTYFIFSFMTVWDISPWYLLMAYIPSACLGGFCIILLGTICYISDMSDEQERAWQLAWMDTVISIGIIIGIFLGPIIFQAYGYTAVFGGSTACCILSALYICFLVPDAIYDRNSVTLSSLFDVHLVKELISTCTKKREGFNRHVVWCCIFCITLMVIIMEGDMTIGFLFTSARLGWDVKAYSFYIGTNIMVSIFGLVLGVKVLSTYGGFSEEVTAILSFLSSLCSSLVRSFTWKSWHMYLSAMTGMFSGVGSPMIRAIISKSVPPEDTGKVFSLTVSIETLTPIVAASLYSMIYSYFMPPTYPLPVWLVSAGICIVIILILINIRVQRAKSGSIAYVPIMSDSELLS